MNFTSFFHLSSGDYRFDLAEVADQQQRPIAYVLVGLHTEMFFWLDTLAAVQWITAAFTLLMVTGSGYWLAGKAMGPVQRITRAARQISETDLHQRLHLPVHDELGELATTFDHMLERLEAAFERQRQFTSDASHELRTPLAIINLEVTRGLTRDLSHEEYHKLLTIIQQETQSTSRLVNDLLTLVRTESSPPPFSYEEVDLGDIVIDTVERLAPLAQVMGIEIRVPPLDELIVQGDHTSLVQLLVNIVENAIKHTTGVGTHVIVDLAQREKNGEKWAKLCVTDDGPGIPEQHLAHLFERFYRADQSRTHHRELLSSLEETTSIQRGYGLGLSIAQWIVRRHGGIIQVRSTCGQGSTFEVWLPLKPLHGPGK